MNEALTIAQRNKRSMVFKRIKNRVLASRKRNLGRMAGSDKIEKRARKKAIQVIRKKLAGKRGENYNNLSYAEKTVIDAQVSKKKSLINKLARRLVPMIRKAEQVRLKKYQDNQKNESTKMKTYKELIEGFSSDLVEDTKFKQGKVKLSNGDVYTMSAKEASLLNQFSKTLNNENKKDFYKNTSESKDSLVDILNFAKEAM